MPKPKPVLYFVIRAGKILRISRYAALAFIYAKMLSARTDVIVIEYYKMKEWYWKEKRVMWHWVCKKWSWFFSGGHYVAQ